VIAAVETFTGTVTLCPPASVTVIAHVPALIGETLYVAVPGGGLARTTGLTAAICPVSGLQVSLSVNPLV
jgi:hypothetical protein